ncbi:MAG: glutaredoxin family protein [Methylococcaceae bacterium]|nr:glutaredoxin family protein [Methylococcaceae bacterium]
MKFILFGTSACHLCEQAEAILHDVLIRFPNIQLELIDIALQTQWQEQYSIRIPVLFHSQSQHELGWPFNEDDVISLIQELSND